MRAKIVGLVYFDNIRIILIFICNEINFIYISIYTTIQPSDEELSKLAILSAYFII